MRLLVLDEPGPQRDSLSALLSEAGHEVRVAGNLLDVRKLRRTFVPQISLVELVRAKGNGFSLAVVLRRMNYGLPVLISDRSLTADRFWAKARGIEHLLTRTDGMPALLTELEGLGGRLEQT